MNGRRQIGQSLVFAFLSSSSVWCVMNSMILDNRVGHLRVRAFHLEWSVVDERPW